MSQVLGPILGGGRGFSPALRFLKRHDSPVRGNASLVFYSLKQMYMALMNFGRYFSIKHTNPLKSLRGFVNLKLALGVREC